MKLNKTISLILTIPLIFCFASCKTHEHVHTFASEYSFDETNHWKKATCEHSDLTSSFGAHNFVDGVCTECNYKKVVNHVHTFSDEYEFDDVAHWQAATCGHTNLCRNYGVHTYVDGYCSVCGKEKPSQEESHVHTFSEEYSFDETNHWQNATCEHTNLTQNLGEHEFSDGVCLVCGYVDPNSIIKYDEEIDSTIGIDVNDLSHLYSAFSQIGENYTLENTSHFTEGALNLYKKDYKKEFSQKTTRMFNEKYCYTYSNLEEYSSLDEYNKIYFYNNNEIKYAIGDKDLLTASSFSPKLMDDDGLSPFKLSRLDNNYFASHTFERVSKYKYISSEDEVINDFLNLCCPYLDNKGYYMTYSKVSIELDAYDFITRIRIYASITQSGKLTEEFINKEYVNWYMMFNETLVKDVNKTSIKCLENL